MKFGINEPQEEDFAMCSLTGQASMLCLGVSTQRSFLRTIHDDGGIIAGRTCRVGKRVTNSF